MDITYLSAPSATNMADEWFEIADLDNFWVVRRFEVLRTLFGKIDMRGLNVGEVGCGHGLIQRQFRDAYGVDVSGFDLNVNGLEASCARQQPRYYYNVLDRHPAFEAQFDLILLFDVVEHIEDEASFMDAVLFHLKPGGRIAINVPALNVLYSQYDRMQGHARRYTLSSLRTLAERMALTTEAITYWGLPMVPLLLARRLRLAMMKDAARIVETGFRPPSATVNRLLGMLARLEIIPQHIAGTSVMGLFHSGRLTPAPTTEA